MQVKNHTKKGKDKFTVELVGRALISNPMMTRFMQRVDIFSHSKVVYEDLELCYQITATGEVTKSQSDLRKLFVSCAKKEFGDNLILLIGEKAPLFINPNVQVISNGKSWIRLIDVVKTYYPNLEFSTDEHFMKISIATQAQTV